MPVGWNDNLDEADWSSISFLQMFRDALNERRLVINTVGSPPPFPTPFAVGADAQAVGVIQTMQDELQNNIIGIVGGTWVDASVPPIAGGTSFTPETTWTFTGVMAACGYGTGFRRRKPREISSTTATTDTQSNTIADGMVAYITAGATIGQAYTRTAGAWVLTPGSLPDVLDSNLAVPNRVPPGLILPGDYIGAHLFTELRDVLNKLVRTVGLSAGAYSTRDVRGTGATTALARADADAQWPTAPTGGYSLTFGSTVARAYTSDGGTTAIVTRWTFRMRQNTASTVTRRTVVMVKPAAVGTYDSQGDPLPTNGIVTTTYDVTAAGAQQDFYVGENPIATEPAWSNKGWTVTGQNVHMYQFWNVAGGFAYVP